MNGSGLFSRWTFETFVPGTIQRSRYNAFRDICAATGRGLELLAAVEELALCGACADWVYIVDVIEELVGTVRTLVDKLQVMNPVEFMDAQDWSKKISFYARLASTPVPVSIIPPYFELLGSAQCPECWGLGFENSGRVLHITPSFGQYVVEVNDLHARIGAILRRVRVLEDSILADVSNEIQPLFESLHLPERLERELDIAAGELAKGGNSLQVRAYLGNAPCKVLGDESGISPDQLQAVWRRAMAARYSPEALAWRVGRGLADEEVPLSVVVMVTGAATFPSVPESGFCSALSVRLEQLLPHVTELQVFALGETLRPERCRSLYDLICLCFERGLKQIFSYAGDPGKGLAATKQLRLDVPVVINLFNLGDAFFPSVAGKSVITVEDLRSVPAWSLFMGLGSPLLRWPGERREVPDVPSPHYSSYAVLSQLYMHCTLRLESNLFTVECDFDADLNSGFIRCWFKGGSGDRMPRVKRLGVLRRVLEAGGFLCNAQGDYLDAVLQGIAEVTMQRSLVTLGLLIAWVQTAKVDFFGSTDTEALIADFERILASQRDA